MTTESMTMNTEENSTEAGIDVQRLVRKDDFYKWWDAIGSGLCPTPEEDAEEFAKRVCFEAWQQRGLLVSAKRRGMPRR